jgi:hypothetical protein
MLGLSDASTFEIKLRMRSTWRMFMDGAASIAAVFFEIDSWPN